MTESRPVVLGEGIRWGVVERMNQKRKLLTLMDIFNILIVVMVHIYVKTKQIMYFKYVQLTECQLCSIKVFKKHKLLLYPQKHTVKWRKPLHRWGQAFCVSTENSHAFCFIPLLYYLNVLAWRINEIINTEPWTQCLGHGRHSVRSLPPPAL